ncbi:YbjN domain-containing protein [Actinobacillus genomosp. 2]|uniref:hypothetical protein n=1 Tax=Actinobacillus genomosp. 2 TaxID=230709 RepID=UPI00244274FF|nr:hypothetical protein [Actinobacillus genomosp. 2]WGE31498.1 YbjN domain-containing protein [Actinobacillus genomosp. 2]
MKTLSKSIMNGILMGTMLFGFLFPISSYAEIAANPRTVQVKDSYTIDEISVLLRENGYLAEKVEPNMFRIDLSDRYFYMILTDTRIYFAAIYRNKSLPDINEWNAKTHLGTAISKNGDVILSHRFYTLGGLSEEYILMQIYAFIEQSKLLNEYLSKK